MTDDPRLAAARALREAVERQVACARVLDVNGLKEATAARDEALLVLQGVNDPNLPRARAVAEIAEALEGAEKGLRRLSSIASLVVSALDGVMPQQSTAPARYTRAGRMG